MYLDGEIDKTKCIELIKRNTRRYSKRQMTWFNSNKDITWFKTNYKIEDVVKCIDNLITD